jgi:hypothetical protein
MNNRTHKQQQNKKKTKNKNKKNKKNKALADFVSIPLTVTMCVDQCRSKVQRTDEGEANPTCGGWAGGAAS